MEHGDFVTVAATGDFGKPRPALVLQSSHFHATSTLTVALLSSTIIDAPLIRVTVTPTGENGLEKTSQIMLDKIMTLKREKVGPVFGKADAITMQHVHTALLLF